MTTTTTRAFEYKDDRSSKFWEISQAGSIVTVRYGKTGTNGQAQEKVFADAAAAGKHVERIVAEKTGKGYVERRDSVPSASAEAFVTWDTSAEQAAQPATKPQAEKSPAAKRKNPAQNSEATPESLMALFGKDDATNRLLAKHPRASAELLEKLSHSGDKATRQAVVGNPNTVPDTYVRLGQQFPKEFLASPALDLLLLVNPALMDQVPESLLIRLLKQADCPASMLAWAANHEQAKVQLAVAMNVNAPDQALQRLRQSKDPVVQEAVQTTSVAILEVTPEKAFEDAVRDRLGSMTSAELNEAWEFGDIGLAQWSALPLTFRLAKTTNSDELSPSAIARVLRDTHWTLESIRRALPNYPRWSKVAQDIATPGRLLEQFAGDSNFEVRLGVARNPSTPVAILEGLARDVDEQVRGAIARHPATPPHALKSMAKDTDGVVVIFVAENPHTPAETLQKLAKHSGLSVRSSVARNPSTPESTRGALLEKLAKSREASNRSIVASNPTSSATVLAALARDFHFSVREHLAGNPAITADVFDLLSSDRLTKIRGAIAKNPAAPLHVLRNLSRDTKSWVRHDVARSAETPAILLGDLAKDGEDWVRAEVALNRNTTSQTLADLSNDSSSKVRGNIARNSSTSIPVLTLLSKDRDSDVRKHVAGNPLTPPSVLQQLTADRVGEVVVAAVRNPSVPLPALIMQVAAKADSVRLALATQAHRSPEICRALWKDLNADVRLAVASCSSLTQEMLDEMIHGTELESELVALLMHPNLRTASVEFIAEKLFSTPATASAWYQCELTKASEEVRAAARISAVLSYHGKDPNKAVLAKRTLAQVMSLCAGPFIEPSRMAKVVGSTDWLVRAAVARNGGTPPNLLKKLGGDAHPLVSSLACRPPVSDESSKSQGSAASAAPDPINLDRTVDEILDRMRRDGLGWACIPLMNSKAWRDRADLNEILSWLKRFEEFDELIERLVSELDGVQLEFFWRWVASAKDAEVRMRLVKHPSVPVEALQRFAVDESVGVLLTVAGTPGLPKALQSEAEKAAIRTIMKRGRFFREMIASNAATLTLAVRERLSKDSDWLVKNALGSAVAFPDWMTRDNTSEDSDQPSSSATVELPCEVADESGFVREVGKRRTLDWLDQLRRAFQREFLVNQGKHIAPWAPQTVADVSNALTWLGYVPESDKAAPSKSARSTDWLTRLGAALHPGATKGILKLLSEDVDPDVARAARMRENDKEENGPRTSP